MTAARQPRPPASRRRTGSSATERRRSEREMAERAQHQLLMQQWQRAGVLLLMSATGLLAGVPLLVLYLIGTQVQLGISERTASLWLMIVIAAWFGTLLFGLLNVSSLKAMDRGARRRWLALLAFPVTTLPAAIVFATHWRDELRPQVHPDQPLRRGWWDI